MAIQLGAQRIRMAIDASNPFANGVQNVLNNLPVALPSGSALQFELFFYFQQLADATALDLTQYTTVTIALQDNADPHNATVFYQGNVAAANFSAATVANWQAATAQQIKLFVPSAQNAVPPAVTNYWLVIYATSTDAAADYVLLCAMPISGKDSGIPNGVPNLPNYFKAGTKLSFTCADGLTRDLQIVQGPGGVWTTTITPQAGYNGVGQMIFSLYCADGSWRDLSIKQVDGEWTVAINQNGHS